MNVSYKFRIYPNETQKALIQRTFGCCRFVFNYYLALRSKKWREEKENFNFYRCNKDLTSLKTELTWLKEVDSTALQSSLKDLDSAFKRFFSTNNGFPNFKKKKAPRQHYRSVFVTDNIAVFDSAVKLPKLGTVKCSVSRKVEGKILSATITQTPTGKYFVSICCKDVERNPLPKTGAVVGIDLGIKTLATTSDGCFYDNPRSLRKETRKLKKHTREMSRKVKGGKNYNKSRIRKAKLEEKISNRRKDFMQKTTTGIVRKYDVICIESLRVKGMMKNHNLARAMEDASLGEFRRELEYKTNWYGKRLQKIDTFFPSSQLCHCCGFRNKETKNLSVRFWTCPQCGASHDRDENAAINILNEGLRAIS